MLTAGVARTDLTPYWGVELTGWGYYIERRWQRIHDPLHATAVAVHDGVRPAIVIALDLMVIDEPFTQRTRAMVSEATGVPPAAVLLTCSHSHNAPAAGGLLGVGECDPFYEHWASHQAATAAILAWNQRQPVTARHGVGQLDGCTFNRTRANGLTDSTLTVLRLDRQDGTPLTVLVNFGAHPTVMTELRPWDVSRDVPGEVCDRLESAFPGATAVYLQGACGDINFLREFATPDRCHEPGERLASVAIEALHTAVPAKQVTVGTASATAVLPTRRWTREEIAHDRLEAQRRLNARDASGWRDTIGRSMTNRPDDMVARHGGDEWKAVAAMCRFHLEWTDRMLCDLEARPQQLETEVQAVRIGDVTIAANSSEFFTPFVLDLRRRSTSPALMFACYANGRIGYLPDAHDIAAKSYAGYQSPKYCNQFPFTPESGDVMCDAMLRVIHSATDGQVSVATASRVSNDPERNDCHSRGQQCPDE